MASNTETRPLLSRLLGRDAAVAQLIVITLLIFVAMTALNPDKFLRYYNFESLTYIAPELGILSIAMMIAMLTGGIDLSIVGVANLAAIVAGVYFRIPAVSEAAAAGGAGLVLHTAAAVLIALVVGLAAGGLNGVLIARLRIIPILATLGTGQIFAGLALVLTGGPAITGFPETWAWIGAGKILGLATPLWVLIVVAGLVALLLARTTLGVNLMLMGTNPRAAIFAGIRSGRMILYSYMLTGMLAAVAGVLLSGRTNSAKADFGASYLLQAVLIAVLGGTNPAGGKGRVLGVLLALVALMLLSSGLQIMRVSNFLIDAVWGAFLVIVIAINYLRSRK
ncbi:MULTISPECIES: ABC transporter permease [Cereibacter]|uniref:Monosaccharide ABC transporter membrane protein (CUT2 family) n=1 Tax=Cereibacter johrii TaxID=445629 RepID=A0ABX5J873_9RHOB|nr:MULTISPECIES: ABC transporter permease [Cereibacter]EKX56668.1 Ribose ABC transport system, permease protein RbsC [Rhodobacter sp. AKP1]MEA5162584.1 ABC transporter permease [Cereibacter johrii]PTM77175.1 monosaccharide ABC transporter membrane protein (CUT2 family) [Cereibacter johrii]QCP87985.1 ABC transporter permease [Cereibacter sphaeroides]RAZ84477.1 ABC transporter permease [Cereibacter johrii]